MGDGVGEGDPETYAIIGAAFEVYNNLGSGFSETLYQEAMEMELEMRSVPFTSQALLPAYYKGRRMKKYYRADLLCYGRVVVELKAISQLTPADDAQLLCYLRATRHRVGLLFNFGGQSLVHRRRVMGPIDDPF